MTQSPRTQYYTATSLDGFIADPANSLEWLFQFGEDGSEDYAEFIAGIGALAMGSTTYEWVLDNLRSDPKGPQPWPYTQPAWIFSSRALPSIDGADLRFVRGDVAPVYREMVEAAQGKNLWLVGGGELVGQFHDLGLLDELILSVAPVTLGGGAPLLPRAITTPPLRLVSSTTLGGTFVQLRYEVQHGAGVAAAG